MSTAKLFPSFICTSCRRSRPLRLPKSVPAIQCFSTTTTRLASGTSELDSLIANFGKERPASSSYGSSSRRSTSDPMISDWIKNSSEPPSENQASLVFGNAMDPPHRLHVYATKHNTHLTLTSPPTTTQAARKDASADLYKGPEPNKMLMSLSAGNIGFRKAGRGSYDAGYQLAAFVLKQIQERGLMRDIEKLEVVLRGFGAGREAVSKALLGQEGRHIRGKITAVVDATRLKFGGTRSPKPRRLG